MKKLIVVLFISVSPVLCNAQDLMDILLQEVPAEDPHVYATFKGTRIINGHSIETRKTGVMEFFISHRFGKISDGVEELFGLDQSNIRMALEYGLTDEIMIGLGRSSFEKTYDGFLKYKLFNQGTGDSPFPVSVTLFGSIARKTLKDYPVGNKPNFEDRLFYTTQVLVARKFNEQFSLQLAPTYIRRNSVRLAEDPHDIFAMGAGMRFKLTRQISINTEYYYTANPLKSIDTKNAFAIALDIETGGHVFQLLFSNANTMIEKAFITETTSDFFSGDIHFGFNISRAFHFKKHQVSGY